MTAILRRLLSADWLAFGVALAAVFLKYLEPSVLGAISLVVFLPSVLREVGVLHDAASVIKQAVILFGVTSVALIWEEREKREA